MSAISINKSAVKVGKLRDELFDAQDAELIIFEEKLKQKLIDKQNTMNRRLEFADYAEDKLKAMTIIAAKKELKASQLKVIKLTNKDFSLMMFFTGLKSKIEDVIISVDEFFADRIQAKVDKQEALQKELTILITGAK
jgi:hypothetical protein